MVAFTAVAFLAISWGVTSLSAASKSPISIRVSLDTSTTRAGHPIHGTAILTNSSSKSILVRTWECDEWLFEGLANKNVPYQPVVPLASCSPTIKLKPGVNRFPITVSTSYQVCQTRGTPRCTKSGMPSLPKGTYHIAVITNGLPKGTSYSDQIRITLS